MFFFWKGLGRGVKEVEEVCDFRGVRGCRASGSTA